MSETKQVWKELIRFDKDIQFIARAVAFEWPKATTEEDLAQEMYIRLAETPASVGKLKELDRRSRLGWLKRIAEQIASIERTDYDYFSGNYCYSSKEVLRALENGALRQQPTKVNPITVDIHIAFSRLPEAKRKILEDRYIHNKPAGDNPSERKKVQRARDALTELMNRSGYKTKHDYHDGPGSRRAISNSGARFITNNQDDRPLGHRTIRGRNILSFDESFYGED